MALNNKNMQELINELSRGWRAERSLSQMTLGRFISELEKLSQDKEIENVCEPHSYRGYYSDLALEKGNGTRTVERCNIYLTNVSCRY